MYPYLRFQKNVIEFYEMGFLRKVAGNGVKHDYMLRKDMEEEFKAYIEITEVL